ncbi:MAG: DNA polymerase IV [Lentisphaerae bacterium GWF2_52_8]|nr:MAG: DNA polymerase IV [Lentisphaerae bacterium GWF2_52_8]
MRKIIHIDMDAFYASVEQRDRPELRGKPVLVGGRPEERGVVAACSYEARVFGIHSAMSSVKALHLCPQAVLLPTRFEVYEGISDQIRGIFRDYSELVEPLSLDEAFIDVTLNKSNLPSATLIAKEIKARIRAETGLTASAGVSFNKFLAKLASDWKKPDGLMVIRPSEAQAFLLSLPIGKFYGVGKVTEKKMISLGIRNGGDLLKKSLGELVDIFGKGGAFYYDLARGRDERPVEVDSPPKSIGRETTFATDIDDLGFIRSTLGELAEDVAASLAEKQLKGRTVTLKVKYFDFSQITRRESFSEALSSAKDISETACAMIPRTEIPAKKIRLIGLSVSNFPDKTIEGGIPVQLEFDFGNWEAVQEE